MMEKVVVAGSGVLCAQIAFQSAFCGKDTTIWLRSPASIERAEKKIDTIYNTYMNVLDQLKPLCGTSSPAPKGLVDSLETMTPADLDALKEKVEAARRNLKFELDMAKALQGADLVIESVAEVPA